MMYLIRPSDIGDAPTPFDYAKYNWREQQHHARYVRFIESMPKKLTCQECGGFGSVHEIVIDETGEGPDYPCGFCEGTGFVTPHMRSIWLRMKQEEKKERM